MGGKGSGKTKYNVEYYEKIKAYIGGGWQEAGDAIPSIAGLSVIIGIPRKTIYAWASKEGNENLRNILEKILSEQERTLINKGLTKEFSSEITKLALGKHGYKETHDITTDDQPITGIKLVPPDGTRD